MTRIDTVALHNDAFKRLGYACRLGGDCSRSDLIGSSVRRPIINSLTGTEIARDVFGMRRESMRNRWRITVELAADKPAALGFLKVDGGLRGLATDMSQHYSTLSRNLAAWSGRQPPLILIGYGKRIRARPPITHIHIPLLTQWLLWTAEARALVFGNRPGALDFETIREVGRCLIPLGAPPPSSGLSRAEARRILKAGLEQQTQQRG